MRDYVTRDATTRIGMSPRGRRRLGLLARTTHRTHRLVGVGEWYPVTRWTGANELKKENFDSFGVLVDASWLTCGTRGGEPFRDADGCTRSGADTKNH